MVLVLAIILASRNIIFIFFGDNVVLFGNVEELVEGKKIVSILSISLRRRFSSKVH